MENIINISLCIIEIILLARANVYTFSSASFHGRDPAAKGINDPIFSFEYLRVQIVYRRA